MVDLHAAGVAGIDSYLHAWLDITASRDDTLDADERSDHVRLDVSHPVIQLFAASVLILAFWNYD